MRSSFASFLLTQKKRRPPAGKCGERNAGVRREKAFPREKPPPAPSRKAYMGKGIMYGKRLPICGSLFLYAGFYANAVFFCFFSSDTEEKKAPGREMRG